MIKIGLGIALLSGFLTYAPATSASDDEKMLTNTVSNTCRSWRIYFADGSTGTWTQCIIYRSGRI